MANPGSTGPFDADRAVSCAFTVADAFLERAAKERYIAEADRRKIAEEKANG